MIDEGETDWKILTIDASHPKASQLNGKFQLNQNSKPKPKPKIKIKIQTKFNQKSIFRFIGYW